MSDTIEAPKPKRTYTRKPKVVESTESVVQEPVEQPVVEPIGDKPKRKYTRKPKSPVEEVVVSPVEEIAPPPELTRQTNEPIVDAPAPVEKKPRTEKQIAAFEKAKKQLRNTFRNLNTLLDKYQHINPFSLCKYI